MQDFLLLATASGSAQSVWANLKEASFIVQAVMILLALMSVTSWYIIGYKFLYIRRALRESEVFVDSFWRSRDIEQIYKHAQFLKRSPVSAMFLAGYTELAKLTSDEGRPRAADSDIRNIQRALHRAETAEANRLEVMVPFLATTGSAAPFIGLFGTVMGIYFSFNEIAAQQSATIGTVAPHIAEALLVTAAGLAAAIPAVLAFNYFQRKIRVLLAQMETFEQDYLNIIRRHFLT